MVLLLAMLRVSYCDHFLSVVHPCVCPLTFSNDFSSEATEPVLLKFHMEWNLLRVGERKIAKMVAVR